MMQSAESRFCNDGRRGRQLRVDGPARRSVLLQRVMNSVSMIVGDIVPHQPPKMIFVECNDVIQEIPATTSNPALRRSVLPRRTITGSFGFQSRVLQESNDLAVELRVAIQDRISVFARIRECLPKLLNHPLSSRMRGHIEVEDPAAAMLNDKEAIEQPECRSGHGEEIHRDDRFAMVVEKGEPSLSRIRPSAKSPQVSRHGSLGNNEAELQKFAVDSGCPPSNIRFCHAPNQDAKFKCDSQSLSRTGRQRQ